MVLQTQIRRSSLVLALFMSVAVVAGMIALRPPLTQMYYVQLGGLIAGAGLVVTLYNYVLTVCTRPQERPAALPLDAAPAILTVDTVPEEAQVCVPADELRTDAAYEETRERQEPSLNTTAVARPAAALVQDETAEELPDTLDALLDMAYEAAEHAPLRAITAYRAAFTRYPNDSYMPYLIIELSTLYKQQGDYDAALTLFDEALALPTITKNEAMVQEFERSRRSLAVVSHMLAARGTPALPFGEVPKELLAEADRRAEELLSI